MQFAIGVTVLECSFVKHSHSPLGVKVDDRPLEGTYYGVAIISA
jgi:hypothetical protein